MLTGHFLFFTPFSVMVILEYPSILAVSEIPRPLNRFVCMFGLIVTSRNDQSPSEASLMVQHDKDLHMQSVQRFWRVFMCTSLCHILMLLAVGSKLKFKIACR